jgi:hypothetical protein
MDMAEQATAYEPSQRFAMGNAGLSLFTKKEFSRNACYFALLSLGPELPNRWGWGMMMAGCVSDIHMPGHPPSLPTFWIPCLAA